MALFPGPTPAAQTGSAASIPAAETTGPTDPRDPTVLTLLSLKLLLLAFFILLTSLAEFQEDRTRQVLESVSEAFNGQVQADRSYNLSSSALANLEELEALFGEVGDLFQSSLPAVKVRRSVDRRLVSFSLPAATLFAPGSTRLRPGRWLLLRRLVEALTQRGRSGLPYELSVLHGVPEDGPAVRPGLVRTAPVLEPARLGALARSLTARGLPAQRFSVGVEPGAPERVRFVLQLDAAALGGPGKGGG